MNQDTIRGQWKRLIGKAKTTWGAHADDEFLKIEGNAQRLTALVERRYGASHDDAERQVKKFLEGVIDVVERERKRESSYVALRISNAPLHPPL